MRMLFTAAFVLVALFVGSAPAFAAEADCAPQVQLDVTKIEAQFILLNEIHGNVEMPRFTAALVCSLLRAGRSVVLALERQGEEQVNLNRYIDSDGGPADREALLRARGWHQRCPDGRMSEAMLDLIENMRLLRRAGQRVGLLAFSKNDNLDVPMTVAENAHLTPADNVLVSRIYDRAMADNLMFSGILYRGYTFVALTGHAYTNRGYPGDPDFMPMGALLSAQTPTFIIGFDSPGGTSWRAGPGSCGPLRIDAGKLFKDDTKIDAVVRLDGLTASPPIFAAGM